MIGEVVAGEPDDRALDPSLFGRRPCVDLYRLQPGTARRIRLLAADETGPGVEDRPALADDRERVGDRLARHLGVSSYCFGANDPAPALPVHSISVGLDPAAVQAFFGLILATPADAVMGAGSGGARGGVAVP